VRKKESNLSINAVAGGGKSTALGNIAKEKIIKGSNVIYLSFNRKIMEEMKDKFGLPQDIAHTFHSLVNNEYGCKEYLKSICPDENIFESENKNKYFNMMIEWWLKNQSESKYQNIDYIFVDEIQDLTPQMFRMLKKLYKINNNEVTFISAGDKYQSIYGFLTKAKKIDVFEKMKSSFGYTEVEVKDISYRSTKKIQKFVNGFHEINYNNNYFNIKHLKDDESQEDVHVYTEQNTSNVFEKVNSIVKNNATKEILILCYCNHEIKKCKELLSYSNNIEIQTIHKMKGEEADVCIIVNTQFNDKFIDMKDLNVWNVAITRPRKELHVITSFPESSFLEHFKKGTYNLHSNQQNYEDTKKSLSLKKNYSLNYKSAGISISDSIIIEIPFAECPFIPFEQQNLKKRAPYITDTKKTELGFSYVITRNNQRLSFDFKDLNKLKGRGYNDDEIINYIREIIKKYFNYHITDAELDKCSLKRLDLALLYKNDNSGIIMNHLHNLLYLSKSFDPNDEMKRVNDCEGQTFYLNSVINDGKFVCGIRIYIPSSKLINSFPPEDDNVIKFEIYRTKQSNSTGKTLEMSLGDLSDVTYDEMIDLYYTWIEYEYSYIYKKEVKNVELQKNKRGIKGFDDVIHLIKTDKLTMREKRIYYHIYLSYLDEDTIESIKYFLDRRKNKESLKEKM